MTAIDVIVCPRCEGRGHQSHHEYTSYHKGEYDVVFSDCGACSNSGLVRRTIVTTFEPFVAGRPDQR